MSARVEDDEPGKPYVPRDFVGNADAPYIINALMPGVEVDLNFAAAALAKMAIADPKNFTTLKNKAIQDITSLVAETIRIAETKISEYDDGETKKTAANNQAFFNSFNQANQVSAEQATVNAKFMDAITALLGRLATDQDKKQLLDTLLKQAQITAFSNHVITVDELNPTFHTDYEQYRPSLVANFGSILENLISASISLADALALEISVGIISIIAYLTGGWPAVVAALAAYLSLVTKSKMAQLGLVYESSASDDLKKIFSGACSAGALGTDILFKLIKTTSRFISQVVVEVGRHMASQITDYVIKPVVDMGLIIKNVAGICYNGILECQIGHGDSETSTMSSGTVISENEAFEILFGSNGSSSGSIANDIKNIMDKETVAYVVMDMANQISGEKRTNSSQETVNDERGNPFSSQDPDDAVFDNMPTNRTNRSRPNDDNLGMEPFQDKGGRRSRRHKKRRSTLKRRRIRRRRTRKGRKRRHTKRR